MIIHPEMGKLERRLLAAGGERQRQILWEGIVALGGFVLTGLFVFFIIDYLTRVPYGVRLALWLGGLGYGVYWFRRRFYLPYQEKYDAQSVALLIEAGQPELQSRLISTIQFQKLRELGPGVSADLVDGLVEQTFKKFTKTIDCRKIINRTWIKKRSAVFSAACVIWLALIALAPAVSMSYFLRLLLPGADYPRNTHIVKIDLPEILPEGEEYMLRVQAEGKLPEIGIVDLDPEVGERLRRDLVPVAAEPGIYEIKMPPLFCPGKLSVVIGDDQRYGMDVVPEKRPSLRSVKMHVEPPAYTGEKPYDVETGTAQMAVGSVFSVTLEPSKKLRDFKVKIHNSDEKVKSKQLADGKITFGFTSAKSFAYTFSMVDEKGLELKDPPLYTISIIPDRSPLIKVEQPVGATEMAPRSRVPFIFVVRDDYKIASVEIKYQVYDAKEVDNNTSGEEPFSDRAQPIHTFFSKKDVNLGSFSYNQEWDNQNGTILPGKITRLWIEALDNNNNLTRSADIYFRVITEAEYRNLLLKKLDEHMEGADDMLLNTKRLIRSLEQINEGQGK